MTIWLGGTLDHAVFLGLSIWTTQRWNAFTRARHDAVVDQYSWDPVSEHLAFRVGSTNAEPTMTFLVPALYQSTPLVAVTVDGNPVGSTALTAKGLDYTAVTVPTGTHIVIVSYNAGITVTPTPTSTATATPTRTPTITPTPTGTIAPQMVVGDQTVESQADNNAPGAADAFQYTAVASG